MTAEVRRFRLLRTLSNLFVGLVGLYGISVTAFLLLRVVVGERFWLVGLLNNYAHLLLLLALVFIPLCLLLRRMRVIVLLVAPLLACLISYTPFFLPRTVSAFEDVLHLHVLTYNLKFQSENLEPVLQIIQQADADIVALQELSTEAAEYFQTELGEEYPYMALHPIPDEPIPGQGVLSRYPITAEEYWRIHLGHQRVALDIEGTDVTLYNAHPIHPFVTDGANKRAEEITRVLERAATETTPLIIAGDFNMTDQTADYWRVAEHYWDSYREVGWGMGFTFPDFANIVSFSGFWNILQPLARIDYVFHNEAFAAVAARVWPESGGSDHRPLLVELAFTAP